MKLGMYGHHVGHPDVVPRGHGGQHRCHVVQQELNGPHPRRGTAAPGQTRRGAHPGESAADAAVSHDISVGGGGSGGG